MIRRCNDHWRYKICSTWLEQQNGYLSHVEVDEVFGFVSDIGSEVSAYNTMPGGVVLLIKFFLDVRGNIFFDVEFLQCYVGAINSVLLHFFVHVCVLNDGFSFGCGHSLSFWIKININSIYLFLLLYNLPTQNIF